MIQKQLGNKVVLIPEGVGYLVKQGSLQLHHTMIVSPESVSLWRDATQADVDAWNERKERNNG